MSTVRMDIVGVFVCARESYGISLSTLITCVRIYSVQFVRVFFCFVCCR